MMSQWYLVIRLDNRVGYSDDILIFGSVLLDKRDFIRIVRVVMANY